MTDRENPPMEVQPWIDSDETPIEILKRAFAQRRSLMLPPPLRRIPLRSGNVIEIAGPSPSAKTQILLQDGYVGVRRLEIYPLH